ncbi:hypothetical protein Tco_0674665, partial [Tanacetum coccineum]
FDDADGRDSLHNQAIFDAIQLMGYEGDLSVLTFNKALFSPQWRFLFHTMNHCISSKSTYWDQIPTNIATAVICLATNQKYNFSKLIFDSMMRHLDAKKKFVMYPRFISVFLTNQLQNVPVPLDHFPINALTPKVFSFMVKKGKKISWNVTPLFPSMLAQPTRDESAVSERPSETQPTPSPPYPKGSGGNHGVTTQAAQIKDLKSQIKQLKKKAKPMISHHNAWIKSVSIKKRLARKRSLKKNLMQKESISKQGRKPAKYELTDAQDEGRTSSMVLEEKESAEKGVSTKDPVSTAQPKVSTDKPKVSTDKLDEGTAEPKDGISDENTASTTVFRDDETIAEFLVSMRQNKAKQKGVEIKDAEDSDRPRATSTRSILTLKPLPKIDPKDKGKKVLEEEAESDAESEGVDEAKRKFDQLVKDEEIARGLGSRRGNKKARIEAGRLLAARLQEEERETFTVEERAKFLYDTIAAQRRFLAQQRDAAIRSKPPKRTQLRNQMMTYLKHVGGKKHADLKNKNFEEIQVLSKKVKRSDKNFIAIGSVENERQIKEMNEESKDLKKKRLKKRVVNETPREEDTAKVPAEQEVTKQGTKKRKSGHVKLIARKRPRPQPDEDNDDEHRKYLRIVTFDSTIKANGHFRAFNYLIEGDLKIMMESLIEENNQELKDETIIYMLVERRYPLSKELLQRMLDLEFEVEEESTVALHLVIINQAD